MRTTKTSNGPSRRTVLAGSAAFAASLGLPFTALAQSATLRWWDIFQPLIPLHEGIWGAFADAGKAKVEYTPGNPANQMQALQLAFRGGEMPDVFDVPNANPATLASLQAADWFAPLQDFKFDKPFQKAVLAEGFTLFGGVQYSFPIFSFRWHFASLWYDNSWMEAVGFDPATGPQSWDDAHKAAMAATKDDKFGLLLPLQFGPRMRDTLTDLAMVAGAPGTVDWKTGDYAYATQPFLDAFDFLLGFQKDGSLHPGSSAVDARQGRSRWAAGEALLFFDGPWNSGVLKNNFPEVLANTGVSGVPTPDGGAGVITRGPITGTYWVAAQSDHQDLASELLQGFTTDDYYVALAERMDQPPLDLSALERANVDPTYRKAIDNYLETVRLGPDALMNNPGVASVYAKMRDISPGLGEIIQGAFSGAFDDPKPFLQELSDAMNRERDRAIAEAKNEGVDVSVDDWVFSKWNRGEDYSHG